MYIYYAPIYYNIYMRVYVFYIFMHKCIHYINIYIYICIIYSRTCNRKITGEWTGVGRDFARG